MSRTQTCSLTNCGLVTPYGGRDLDQHWFRYWLVAWRHQAITWTNVDLSSQRSRNVNLRAISLQISQPSVTKISLEMIFLGIYWNLPGVNELMCLQMFYHLAVLCLGTHIPDCKCWHDLFSFQLDKQLLLLKQFSHSIMLKGVIREIWIYFCTLISQDICRLATGLNCPLYTDFRQRSHWVDFMIFPEHRCQRGPSMRAKSISNQRRTQPGICFHTAYNYTNWLIVIHATNFRFSTVLGCGMRNCPNKSNSS